MSSYGRGIGGKMSRNVYDDWNEDGTLPKIKPCPFCGSAGMLNDNGYERPVIDPDTGAYVDMDFFGGDGFWCECPECGAILPGASTPEEAIEQWNRRDEPTNDPLTLDQLLEMGGEPVWVVPVDGKYFPKWMLVDTETEVCRSSDRSTAMFKTLGKAWNAYRRRPEEKT